MSASEKKPQTIKSTFKAASNFNRSAVVVQDGDLFCKYSHHACTQNCLDGYDFCIRHILEDKTAPYKQCAYMTKAGRKCPAAAPKLEKKDVFCSTHNRKSLLARQRLARKRRPGETGESLLEELVTLTSAGTGNVGHGVPSQHEHRRNKMFIDSVASRALEYASSSDSESELGPLVEQTWRDDGDSDAESIDSDQEDLLKYAGVYTTEEVAQIMRDKLIRLQALYIDQFKRLKHMLLVKRRQYLKARGPEREAFGSVKLCKKDPLQKDRYKKLRAMQQYHKKAGKEALLQRQSTERRIQASVETGGGGLLSPGRAVSGIPAKPSFPTCSFLDEGVVCGARAVPLSKFCQKHILHDPCQLLYQPCPFADSQCGRPVPILLNTQFCSLHQPLPQGIKIEDDKDGLDEAARSLGTSQEKISPAAHTKPGLAKDNQRIEVKQEIKSELHNLSGIRQVDDHLSYQSPGQQQSDQSHLSSAVPSSSTHASNSTCRNKSDLTDGGGGDGEMEEGEDASDPHIPGDENVNSEKGNDEEEREDMVIFTLGGEDDEEDTQGR